MKAIGILPAAGKGTRLGLATPKELVPVTHDGKLITVIESSLRQLHRADIDEAIVVITPEKEIIRLALGDFCQGVKLTYAYQTEQRSREGLPDGVCAAYDFAQGYDLCVMLMPDVYFTGSETVRWLTTLMRYGAGIDVGVSVWQTQEPWRFGVVRLKGDRIEQVIDKPDGLPAPQLFWGAVAFRSSFWPYLKLERETFSHALSCAAQHLTVVEAPTAGKYLDIGTPVALFEAIKEINR